MKGWPRALEDLKKASRASGEERDALYAPCRLLTLLLAEGVIDTFCRASAEKCAAPQVQVDVMPDAVRRCMVDPEDIVFSDNKLGSGAFGAVWLGTLRARRWR